MPREKYFADLILPVPLDQLFTYRVPEHLIPVCLPGKRAIVQFGKKKIYSAIIRNLHQEEPEFFEVKEIIEIIDENPIVTTNQFKFWDWIAGYYMCSPGEIFVAGVPSGLRLESSTNIFYNEDFFNDEIGKSIQFNDKENILLDALSKGKPLNLDDIRKIISLKNCLPTIKSLHEKGCIFIEENLIKKYKPKTEKYVILSNKYFDEEKLNEAFDDLKKAPKQAQLLTHFLETTEFFTRKEIEPVGLKNLLDSCNSNMSIASELVKKGIFEIRQKKISRFETDLKNSKSEVNKLEEFQQTALDEIISQFKEKDTVLLNGVTSSGKTEIYIHLISKYLNEGKQILYLLPEIALTTQIIERLRRAFGNKVGIYHSRFNDSERVETYTNVLGVDLKDGSMPYQIILGVRSALFLPFKNPGLIIVDEEHESTYKQFNPAPRYQARDSAIVLAKIWDAKTLLGTATPSIESYFNARTDKYGLVNLKQRYLDISLPKIEIADVKEARRKKQMKSIFTPLMLNEIGLTLNNGEQIILFQNRRGFSLYIECFDCGWIPKCKYCDVSLTYHRHNNQLVCHYCGYSRQVYDKCDNCKCTDLRTRGFGTEKVEEELKIFFPEANIKRLDLDSAKGKNAYAKIIGDFEDKRIDILVGTQMVSKGLDFDGVSLVGILDANQMLNYPDFRAYERSFQLMVQVGGRAGRKHKQGKVIIQTVSPDDQIMNQVKNADFENMFNNQYQERKQFQYPPLNRLINITLKHKDKELLDKAAFVYASWLRQSLNSQVIGPEYPIISRIYEYFHKNILIKLNKDNLLSANKKIISDLSKELLKKDGFKSILVVFDVDPY